MSIKREVEEGMTTVNTAKTISWIILITGLGALLLGISLGGLFF